MKTFQIDYHTENHYENSVLNAHWQLLVLPQNNYGQELVAYSTKASIDVKEYLTPHLFSGTCLNIQSVVPFTDFYLDVGMQVNIKPFNPFDFNLLSVEEEKSVINDLDYKITHSHFLQVSPLTALSDEVCSQFSLWRDVNLLEYLRIIMAEILCAMEYQSGETAVDTTAAQAMVLKKGVCQDFAHILIGILRQQGIASRYVCGYLNQGDGSEGIAQLHAWVECFIPQGGWIGVDPANKLFANHSYIKISHGRDFNDCTPIIGVLNTKGSNKTDYSVKVSQIQQNQ